MKCVDAMGISRSFRPHKPHRWWGDGLNAEPWECPGITKAEAEKRNERRAKIMGGDL